MSTPQVRLTIENLQRVQAANNARIAALRPNGALGQAVKDATISAHRYSETITHVDTGAWRVSHRMKIKGLTGEVFIQPDATNTRSNVSVSRYVGIWERRGGELAVYQRTLDEHGPEIQRQTGLRLERIL